MNELLPAFLDLTGRRVLLVGGGPVAAGKLVRLLAARADVRVVAPEVEEAIDRSGVPIARRTFEPGDLDGAWLVVAAATPDVNRAVASAAQARRLFVNAVDDPANATAYLSGVVRRDGVTLAISTSGAAPGLTALLREALDSVLPRDLAAWVDVARRERAKWRRRGVPMEERRPLLLEALNQLYTEADEPRQRRTRSASGHVSIVGAGPGDPGLLTRRAVARLRAADLVLYDALIDHRVLKLARHAQRFFVGKRAGRHAMSQQAVNALMVRAARRGKRVVRLKGGDPFLFGRGGEEVLALTAAAVAFDVVPGVTSAVAAPELVGIPVTHRGISSAVLIASGHDVEAFSSSVAGLPPNGVTLVILMGVGRRAALAARLLERGWLPQTPAAIVMNASRPDQSTWLGTLDQLADETTDLMSDGPGTIVVGQVVALASVAGSSETSTERAHHVSR